MSAAHGITYAEACADPHLFGPWFQGPTWSTWRVLDKALFGEPLTLPEFEIFRELTGRDEAPTDPVKEAWLIMGRRSGKDVKAASIVTYLATIGAERYGWLRHLVPGERGVVQLLAVDRDQARICLDYTRAFFRQPMLAETVKDETRDGFELTNRIAIEITTNDQRRVRGRTVVAAVLDEVAHWRNENSVNPDSDVYRSIKPGMATIPGAMLFGISSAHARRGLLWSKFKTAYGQPGSVLVVRAPTWRMNPNVPRDGETITEAFADDPAWAASEYGSEFRTDLEQLFEIEAIEAVTERGVRERAPSKRNRYRAFVDPSGGRSDAMTLAIAHANENGAPVLDCLREVKPPFSPAAVVQEFAGLLADYGLQEVTGDRYGGEFVQERFRDLGIAYRQAEATKSEIYIELLPLVNSGRCHLLDNDKLAGQLTALERTTGRGTGRDVVDHPRGAHDDLANAAAGALWLIARRSKSRAGVLFGNEPKSAPSRPSISLAACRTPEDVEIWARAQRPKRPAGRVVYGPPDERGVPEIRVEFETETE